MEGSNAMAEPNPPGYEQRRAASCDPASGLQAETAAGVRWQPSKSIDCCKISGKNPYLRPFFAKSVRFTQYPGVKEIDKCLTF
jgi:hypothetical protein